MFALILLPPLFIMIVGGFGVAILAIWFLGRKKPWFGKNNLLCFLGICLGAFIWVSLWALIPVGEVGSNSLEGYPALLLKSLMLGMTPVCALPALMAYGPKKN